MAGTSILERESQLNNVSEAQREHDERISKNYQKLMGETPATQQEYYQEPTRSYSAAPVQEREYAQQRYQGEIPSAAQRIADYMPITVGMKKLQRMGDMPSYSSDRVVDYAPVIEAAPQMQTTAAPARAPLFENISFRDGQVYDESVIYAPTQTEPVQAPEYDSSYMPSEDDSIPSRETMDTIRRIREMETAQEHVGFFASLSRGTKVALAAVAAAIIILLVAVCVNTAVLNQLSASAQSLQSQAAQLEEENANIQSELNQIKDPANIAEWAISQNMTRG